MERMYQEQEESNDKSLLVLMVIAVVFVIWLLIPPINKFVQFEMIKAESAHKKALKTNDGVDPNGHLYYLNNAIYNVKINRKDKALTDIENAVRYIELEGVNTKLNKFYSHLTDLYIYLGEYEEALNSLNNISYIGAVELFKKALLQRELGLYSDMLTTCNDLIDKDPSNYESFACIANANYELGDYEKTLNLYGLLIDKSPEIAVYYADRAYYEKLIGENQAADSDMAKAKELLSTIECDLSVIYDVIKPDKLKLEPIKY